MILLVQRCSCEFLGFFEALVDRRGLFYVLGGLSCSEAVLFPATTIGEVGADPTSICGNHKTIS